MTFEFDPVQTLGITIMVLYTGMLVIRHTSYLRNNDIPVPVVGGLLFALLTSLAYGQLGLKLHFDMALKEPMMLAFFATIGLGADMRMLARGGQQLLVFGIICVTYLIVQDGIGMLTAISLDLHPLVGLLGGSITLSGGHGTGAAWAERFGDTANLAGAMELAMACATFGLILGGLIGGPVAGRLIRKHDLQPEAAPLASASGSRSGESPINADNFLLSLFYIVVCLAGGKLMASVMSDLSFTLPTFVWALLIGVVIRNGTVFHQHMRVHSASVEMIGSLALSLFLAMALMSLQLWEVLGLAGPLMVLLGVQVTGIVIFASFITFRLMGGRYNAAVVAGGHCGFGLGATPTAVANMEALTRRFGAAPQAFLVVPLMGAFFIDLLNAIVIQAYLSLPIFGY